MSGSAPGGSGGGG
jgi:cullin 3